MKITTSRSKLYGEINIPGSKSHTIRALVVALIADGTSIIRNPLIADDTMSCFNAVKTLGAKIEEVSENGQPIWRVTGTGGNIPNINFETIDLGNSGTSLRLLAGMIATTPAKVTFDGDASLRSRDMSPLIDALTILGCDIKSTGGKVPITIQGPISSGKTTVLGKCSQYVSSLLFSTPRLDGETQIDVKEVNETPYIDITLKWLDRLGINYKKENGYDKFIIPGNQKYKAFDFTIPADFSTATFPLLGVAISGGDIRINNLDFSDEQGDKATFEIFEQLGVNIEKHDKYVRVHKSLGLKGNIKINLNATPDALPAISVAAAFANGTTTIYDVKHARNKETDRISAMCCNLKEIGVKLEEKEDGIVIYESKLNSNIEVDGFSDHRIIMSMAIAGMALEGELTVKNADEVSVTYPNFIKDFKQLGAAITTS